MIRRNTYLKSVLLVTLVGFVSSAMADTPKAQLQETMERVMAITQTFRSEKDFTDNKAQLKQIILPRFYFDEMARRSLGDNWNNLKAREAEFVTAFVQFAESSYMSALGSYRGEKVVYGRERVDENFAEVDTQVLDSHGAGADIMYKLHLVGKEWKVYDVVIDQISLVSNFHSQFGRILRTASMDELMRRLREKGTQG